MMLTICKETMMMFQNMNIQNIKNCYEAYITKKQQFYRQYPRLAIIEILYLLYLYQEDNNDRHVLHDIYECYGSTGFLVSKLTKEDMEHISSRYMEELQKSKEEGVKENDVQEPA